MASRWLVRCEICGSRLAEDRVGNCCGPCHRMIRCMQCRDSRATHPRSEVDLLDAYNGLGPEPSPEHIRQRARQRAQKSESEMSCILRRAAALGMQYGEYMIYLETQQEKSHEEQELRQHSSDGPGSH